MGVGLSRHTQPNDSSTPVSTSSPKTPTQEKALETTTAAPSNPEGQSKEEEEEEEEEEEGECGFCLFMKGGPCKEPFIAWEKCILEIEKKKMKNKKNEEEENEEDKKCNEVAYAMLSCVEAYPEYYDLVNRAKDAYDRAEEEAAAQEGGGEKDDDKEDIAQQQSGDSGGVDKDKGDSPN